MLSARAVEEMLPLFSRRTRWMCSHSMRSTDIGTREIGAEATAATDEA